MITQSAKMTMTIAIEGIRQLGPRGFLDRFKMKPSAMIKATDSDTARFTRFEDLRSHSGDIGQNIFLKILTSLFCVKYSRYDGSFLAQTLGLYRSIRTHMQTWRRQVSLVTGVDRNWLEMFLKLTNRIRQ